MSEVAFFSVVLSRGNSIEMFVILRLVDPAEGTILGMPGYVGDTSKTAPVTATSNPQAFVRECRTRVNALAHKGLKDLKLL